MPRSYLSLIAAQMYIALFQKACPSQRKKLPTAPCTHPIHSYSLALNILLCINLLFDFLPNWIANFVRRKRMTVLYYFEEHVRETDNILPLYFFHPASSFHASHILLRPSGCWRGTANPAASLPLWLTTLHSHKTLCCVLTSETNVIWKLKGFKLS